MSAGRLRLLFLPSGGSQINFGAGPDIGNAQINEAKTAS
jgi:hypothetical protein